MPKPSLLSLTLSRAGRGVMSCISIALLAGCSTMPAHSAQPALAQGPGMQLTRYSYAQIPGWDEGDQQLALVALRRSCEKIVARAPLGVQHDPRGQGPWLNSCRAVLASGELTSAWEVRRLLEAQFTPYAVTFNGNPQGLFTGYYQPTIEGSLQPTAYFDVPLYGVPRSLKRMRWQDGSMRTVWWQDGHYTLLPSRADIVAGPLLPNTPVLAWVHDQVDRYFLQVQGSGTILLTDGRELPVGYAAQNGYPYYPIGRYLLQIGAIPLKQMSMQTIRAWLKEHPAQVTMILNMDPSFVFFRITRHEEPIGAQGVPLTPGRSLAVDLNYIWLGTPIWLDTAYPNPGHNNVPGAPLRRLMIAQDTGGAIQGAVRGDVFWGSGEQATFLAGHMQSTGRYWLLLPKGLTPEGYRG